MSNGNPLCPVCSENPAIDAHHLIGRGFYQYRWIQLLGIKVCRTCHKNPSEILKWVENNRPHLYQYRQYVRKKILGGEKPQPIDLQEVYYSLLAQQ